MLGPFAVKEAPGAVESVARVTGRDALVPRDGMPLRQPVNRPVGAIRDVRDGFLHRRVVDGRSVLLASGRELRPQVQGEFRARLLTTSTMPRETAL